MVTKNFCRDCKRDISYYKKKKSQCSTCAFKQKYFKGQYWKVLERDNYICVECKKIKFIVGKRTVNVHHINDNNKDNRLKNLEVLCIMCHRKKRKFICKGCKHLFTANNPSQKRCDTCRKERRRLINKYCVARFFKRRGLSMGPKMKENLKIKLGE